MDRVADCIMHCGERVLYFAPDNEFYIRDLQAKEFPCSSLGVLPDYTFSWFHSCLSGLTESQIDTPIVRHTVERGFSMFLWRIFVISGV